MDYEKAYNDALERARKFYKYPLLEDSGSVAGYIFPELKESEDEKVIKEITQFINDVMNCKTTYSTFDDYGRWIAWLEKRKPAKWNPDDEIKLEDALWCCNQAASFAKNEDEMGTAWFAGKWLKSLKQRMED